MVFRKEIHSEVEIEGTAQEVWSILTDFDRYGEWNPGFSQVRGRAEVGATLDVTFLRSGGRTTEMHPRVLVAEPGREFRWLGRLLLPGVFDGEHRFEIHQVEPGRVRFVQAERFRGVLVPFFRRMIEVDTLTTFGEVNDALAARVVERRSAV